LLIEGLLTVGATATGSKLSVRDHYLQWALLATTHSRRNRHTPERDLRTSCIGR